MMRKISEDLEVIEEVSSSEIYVSPEETPITHCILHNSVKLLVDTLNDEANELLVPPLLNERNATGKSPLELCAILGRTDIMKELLSKGADVNLANCEGIRFFSSPLKFVFHLTTINFTTTTTLLETITFSKSIFKHENERVRRSPYCES